MKRRIFRDYKVSSKLWEVHRTIQRDLITLSSAFGLLCDQRSKPYGWSFRQGVSVGVPVKDMGTALALELANQYLSNALPRALLKDLEPYMNQARKRLSGQFL